MRFIIDVDKNGVLTIQATEPRENPVEAVAYWGFISKPSHDKKTNSIKISLSSDVDYAALKAFLGEHYSMRVTVHGEEKYNYDAGKTDKPALIESIKPYKGKAPQRPEATASSSGSTGQGFSKMFSLFSRPKNVAASSSSSATAAPNLSELFHPRVIDIQKSTAKDHQGFDKSSKYSGQQVVDDPTHRIGGHYNTVGGVLRYTSSSSQQAKERFVQPSRVGDYFTYYCYEIYQYCGVNTPKYRYGADVGGRFANIATLIPSDKIPKRDVLLQGKNLFQAAEPKLDLLEDQQIHHLTSNSRDKISGNFFGADLIGFLLQNGDIIGSRGPLNAYFIERQNRQHFIVIDMNKVNFKESDHDKAKRFEFLGKEFNKLATLDQQLAVVSKVNRLLEGDLEKIYYSPRATQMFYELQPALAKEMLWMAAWGGYGFNGFQERHIVQPILDEFGKKLEQLIATTKDKDRNVEMLCAQIRALALTYRDRIAALPGTSIAQSKANTMLEKFSLQDKPGNSKEEKYQNWQKDCDESFLKYLNDPVYSPDLQVQEIRKNGKALIEHFAPNPQVLRDFEKRERERGQIADQVIQRLKIQTPDDAVVKEYIIEDLRGKYYEKLKGQELIDRLVKDFTQELGISTRLKKW